MDIQNFLKKLGFDFYLYSLIALLTTFIIVGLFYSHYSSLIKHENTLLSIHTTISSQINAVSNISDLTRRVHSSHAYFQDEQLRSELSRYVQLFSSEYEHFLELIHEIKDQSVRHEMLATLEKGDITSKVGSVVERYKGIEDLSLINLSSIRGEVEDLSNVAFRGLFAILDSVTGQLLLAQAENKRKSQAVGNYLITLIVIMMFVFWLFFFRPIYRRLIYENFSKNEALANARIANSVKNDFLANINHEIRTPMTTILGYSELLSSGEEFIEEERNRISTAIQTNAQRLLELIDEILDLSKFELGEFDFDNEEVDVKKVLDGLHSVLSFKAAKQGIKLRFNFLTEYPHIVVSNERVLKQILFNVVNNAIKFTPEGHVTLEVSYNTKKSSFNFRVIDTGKGIDEKEKNDIFMIFSQTHGKFNRQYQGSGVGLALTKKLLTKVGGNIKLVETEVMKGSTFELYFPVEPIAMRFESDQTHFFNSLDNVSLKGRKVLVVDDTFENLILFERYLKSSDASVVTAKDGVEALELLSEHEFDAVLLDIQMPKLDGYQVLKQLKTDFDFKGPVIALTAHAMSSQIKQNLDHGFDGHISKPVKAKDLVAALYHAIES